MTRPYVPVRLHRLVAANDESWRWFPVVLRRCAAFVERYQSETNAALLDAQMRAKFVTGDESLGLWVAIAYDPIRSTNQVVAHMTAFIEETPFGRRAFVVQLESDVAFTAGFMRDGMQALEAWARRGGATRIELWTSGRPKHLFRRLGFAPHRVIMRRPLAAVES